VKKFGTPLVSVLQVNLSTKKDTFVVLHVKGPDRDFVLDMGINGEERVSEFVTCLVQEYKKLTGQMLPVKFSDRIIFNNSRTDQKPGKDEVLTFEASVNPKQAEKGCVFKSDGKNGNVIVYPA